MFLTNKTSTPKLFEIYDHLALGSVGHPADIEKVRQTVIDAAHVDGFTRSPGDVSARRLVSYNLAPALKAAFEQIFAAPLLFRGILAELGATPNDDALWRVDYDGSFSAQNGNELAHGMVISGPRQVSKDWIAQTPKPTLDRGSLKSAALSALRLLVWAKLRGTKDQGHCLRRRADRPGRAQGKSSARMFAFEAALLDRTLLGQRPSPTVSPRRMSWDFKKFRLPEQAAPVAALSMDRRHSLRSFPSLPSLEPRRKHTCPPFFYSIWERP